jgi:condensin complex subunit 2
MAKTLSDNQSLSMETLELDFAADPLFQKTASDFDEGGAKGLLLSHLDISSDGRIIFDASDFSSTTMELPSEDLDCDLNILQSIQN